METIVLMIVLMDTIKVQMDAFPLNFAIPPANPVRPKEILLFALPAPLPCSPTYLPLLQAHVLLHLPTRLLILPLSKQTQF